MPGNVKDFATAGVSPELKSKVPTTFYGKPKWPEGLTITRAYKARLWADEQISAGIPAETVSQAIFDSNGWGLGNVDERLSDVSPSIMQGLTSNFADEIGGGVAKLTGGDYTEERDRMRGEAEVIKNINPVGSTISEILVGLPITMGGGIGAGVGKSVLGATLRQGGAGGLEGALQGAGATESDVTSPEGLTDILTGLGIGAGLGGSLGGTGYMVGEFGRKMGGPTKNMAADVLWRQGIDPASVAAITKTGQAIDPNYLPIDVSEGMGDIGAQSIARGQKEIGSAKAPIVQRPYLKRAQENVQEAVSGGEGLADIIQKKTTTREKFLAPRDGKMRITKPMRDVLDTTEANRIVSNVLGRKVEGTDITPEVLEGVREELRARIARTEAGTVKGDDYRDMLDRLVRGSKSKPWKELDQLDNIASKMKKATDDTKKMIDPRLTPDEMRDKIIESTGLKDEDAINTLQTKLTTAQDMFRTRRKLDSTSGQMVGAEGPSAGTGAAILFGGWSWKEFSAARTILESMGVKSEQKIAEYLAKLATTGNVKELENLPKLRKAKAKGGSQIPGQGVLDMLLPEIQESRRGEM